MIWVDEFTKELYRDIKKFSKEENKRMWKKTYEFVNSITEDTNLYEEMILYIDDAENERTYFLIMHNIFLRMYQDYKKTAPSKLQETWNKLIFVKTILQNTKPKK